MIGLLGALLYGAMVEEETEAARDTGKWLKSGQSLIYPEKFRNYFCSECGFELDEHVRTELPYCPNCGVKMDLDEVKNE